MPVNPTTKFLGGWRGWGVPVFLDIEVIHLLSERTLNKIYFFMKLLWILDKIRCQ
jgi:hypothetical protein